MSVFMCYEGIEGEATDANNRGAIDIETWRWGVRRRVTSASSTKNDRESSNAEITSLFLTKRMDSASPYLYLASCCGRAVQIVLRLTKTTSSGGGSDTYMEYILKHAVITNYTVGGSAQDTKRPLEQITISFRGLETRYTPYDDDGNALSPISVQYDVSTNGKG